MYMIFDKYNIPDSYKDNNILYHYTSIDTALKHILFNSKLRLSPRKSSIDPIENNDILFSFSKYSKIDQDDNNNVCGDLYNKYKKKHEAAKQICFCQNSMKEKLINDQNYEYFGFLKPRMWDQYGNSYNGVCLCFSLNKFNLTTEHIHGPLDYIGYDELLLNDQRLDENRINENGIESFSNLYDKEFNKIFFRKHKDYVNEDEYRIVSFDKNDYVFIDISESIQGMIVSENSLCDYDREAFKHYSDKLNINLLFIYWHGSGISIRTYEDYIKDNNFFSRMKRNI